jgi:hypothetical protein
MEIARHNVTMCSMLSQNCTWSAKWKMCHSRRQTRDADGERSDGRWGQGHNKEDSCTETAGHNESNCVSLEPKCIWAASRKICRSANPEHDEEEKDSNDHHGGKEHQREKEDMCFELAGHDEDKCGALASGGKCAWSSVGRSCFLVAEHTTDEDYHHEGDNKDSREQRLSNTLGEPSLQEHDTKSEVMDTISLTLRLNNLHFSLLSANPYVLSDLRAKVKRVIATTASKNVLPSDVDLEIMPGSVIISASLRTFSPRQSSADAIQTNLNNDQMLKDITTQVNAIDGIESVTTGEISTNIVSPPTLQKTSASPSKPESESKLSFIVGSLAGGVAMLSMVSCGCLVYRRIGRGAQKNVQAELHVIGKEIHLDV